MVLGVLTLSGASILSGTWGTYPERGEYPLVVLGVLAHPGVAVVDVGLRDVLIHDLGHHDKPLRQEVRLPGVKQRSTLNNSSKIHVFCY